MAKKEPSSEAEVGSAPVLSVAQAVLSKFFGELSKSEGLAAVASSLERVVVGDGVFAEPAIRAALFPDTP